MSDLDRCVEELGAVLTAPDLPRSRRTEPGADKKWQAGDILMRLTKAEIDAVAEKLEVSATILRSYAEVSRAFPPDARTTRMAWTTYRELRHLPVDQRPLI